MLRPRTTVSVLLAVAAMSSVVACGDSESGDTTAAPSTASTSAGGSATTSGGSSATTAAAARSAAECAEGKTLDDGRLVVATGSPAFPPYVMDDDPTSGKGFESAVAYAVAGEMGFDKESVEWTRSTFDQAIQPGAKDFDINLQQFSITPRRARNITFSAPYYASNQAVVGFDDSDAVGATSVAELRGLKFGAQSGTTSLGFIQDVIQPEQEAFVYNDNVGAKQALESNQIDAIVLDLPTAFFVTAVEIEGSTIIGQFPVDAGGQADEFGMVFEKDNPLVECVDLALGALRKNGTLEKITQRWMTGFADAPEIAVE